MLNAGMLRQDFRYQGYPKGHMESPRHPITSPEPQDKLHNEENFVRVFGRPSFFNPDRPRDMHRQTPGGLVYGSDQVDNSHRTRGQTDPFGERSQARARSLRQQRQEAQDEVTQFKQEKRVQDRHREEHERKVETSRRDAYAERLHSPVREEKELYVREPPKPTRGHDLFIDTLGGEGGTEIRQDGFPRLRAMPDPRMGAHRPPPGDHRDTHRDDVEIQKSKIREQEQRIDELKRSLQVFKDGPGSPRGMENGVNDRGPSHERYKPSDSGYIPSFGSTPQKHEDTGDLPRMNEQRSLDLDMTRGGAGAPIKDPKGKPVTRFPVTMSRNDYGVSKIQEKIPGKIYSLPPDPPYDPFGKPGAGAPLTDNYGNRRTHLKSFERKTDSADQAKQVRAKEVMLHELRVGMEEQIRKKNEERRRDQQPHQDLAAVIQAHPVGRPKVDPITGTLANHHLGNSDVSKVKMNYQPKDESEKRDLHEYLREQVEEGERNKQLDKLRNIQESNKHFDQMDSKWGMYGGGAPKDRVVRKKVNLDNALFHYGDVTESPRQETSRQTDPRYYDVQSAPKPHQSVNPSYQKRYIQEDIRHQSPDVTPRFVRSTMDSTSRNLYEYPMGKSSRHIPQTGPPYATGSGVY